MAKGGETSNKVFSYFMVGTLGLLTAAGAKATVQGEQLPRFLERTAGAIDVLGLVVGV